MAERRLWDSINTIPDGFAVFDANSCLVAANAAYLAAFRGTDIALGATYGDILRTAARGGLIELGGEAADDWCARMLDRWQTDSIDPVVVQFRWGVWVRLIDRRARDGDMVSLALNITEEMRIWAAIEAIPDGFVLFDREERLLAFNHRYREMFPDSAELMVPGTSV
jgi:PAS domain-containing protein